MTPPSTVFPPALRMWAMADSDAERQKRYRRHKAGDHSLCDPARCEAAGPPGPSVTESRGRRLWQEMHEGLKPGQLVLLEEACRIADRLDRLDAQLDGEDWLRFRVNDDVTDVTVTVDRVLSEARQQAVALKQLISELRQSSGVQRPGRPQVGSGESGSGSPGKAGGVVDLKARIAERRGSTAG